MQNDVSQKNSNIENIEKQNKQVQKSKYKETKLPQCLQSLILQLQQYKNQLFKKSPNTKQHPFQKHTQKQISKLSVPMINQQTSSQQQKNTQIWSIFIFILQKSLKLNNLKIYSKIDYENFIKKCFLEYEQLKEQTIYGNEKGNSQSKEEIKEEQKTQQKKEIVLQKQQVKQSQKLQELQKNKGYKYANLSEYRKQLVMKLKSKQSKTTAIRKSLQSFKYKINLYTKQQKRTIFSLIQKITSPYNFLFVINFYKYFQNYFFYELKEVKYKHLTIQLQFGKKLQEILEKYKKKYDNNELSESQQEEEQLKLFYNNNKKPLPFYQQNYPDFNSTKSAKLLQKIAINHINYTIYAVQVYQQLKKPIPNLSYTLNNYIKFLNCDYKPWQLQTSKMFHFIHKLSNKQNNKFIVKFLKSKCFSCQAQYFSSSSIPKIRLYQSLSRKMQNCYGYYAVDKENW